MGRRRWRATTRHQEVEASACRASWRLPDAVLARAGLHPRQPLSGRRGQPGRAGCHGAPAAGMRTYLGVDGGGTRTALCLLSEEGRALAGRGAPSCSSVGGAADEGVCLVARVLREAVAALAAAAGLAPSDIAFAFFGLP